MSVAHVEPVPYRLMMDEVSDRQKAKSTCLGQAVLQELTTQLTPGPVGV